jgi:hypothetical protein
MKHFDKLIVWLRSKGIRKDLKALHALRNHFGDVICSSNGEQRLMSESVIGFLQGKAPMLSHRKSRFRIIAIPLIMAAVLALFDGVGCRKVDQVASRMYPRRGLISRK